MSGALDLSQTVETQRDAAQAALIDQLAAILSATTDRIVLASDPLAVARAFETLQLGDLDDRTADGVLALDVPIQSGATLLRLGTPRAPLSAVCAARAEDADTLRAALIPPALALLEAGQAALSPGARLAARTGRAERDAILERTASAMADAVGGKVQVASAGLEIRDADSARIAALGLTLQGGEGVLTANVPDVATAKRLEDYLGLKPALRRATISRTTKETDIALSVDLDGEGAHISTGVHFFDHMLEQIARHGGIGLEVSCEGDVEVDAHHTIEDVCLALGEGLRTALGDKRGIARFGFEVPMDETRAGVWIDLSGRPYALFEGSIPGERVGDFPVEMCEHAFRSLSETMRAAIHVKVEGENAHHMIESCFKAFGRALRMAVRIEGEALPSTKGVL